MYLYIVYAVSLSPLFRPYVNFSISCTNKAFFGVINHAPAVPRLSTKCLSITDPSVAVHSAELSKSPVAAEFRLGVSPEIVVRTHALPSIESRYIDVDIVIDRSEVTFSPSWGRLNFLVNI